MIYNLELAGGNAVDHSFDVHTKRGAYAGIVAWHGSKGFARVYFNSNATKGSARKFASVQDAVEFIHRRREKRGLN